MAHAQRRLLAVRPIDSIGQCLGIKQGVFISHSVVSNGPRFETNWPRPVVQSLTAAMTTEGGESSIYKNMDPRAHSLAALQSVATLEDEAAATVLLATKASVRIFDGVEPSQRLTLAQVR